MRSKRTPDRVHVVRPPEQGNNKSAARNETREIALMLAQISDKLKRSENERYKLLSELRDYRETLNDLKSKADTSEKAYRELEDRIQNKDSEGSLITSERQAKFEKTLKATEEKMVKAIAGQALIDKRLQDTEEKQIMIHQQIEKSMDDQKKIEHQIEMNVQDKSRLLLKMERLESMMNDTQETLRAKAMVLLTDKNDGAEPRLQAPVWNKDRDEDTDKAFMMDKPNPFANAFAWDKIVNVQMGGILLMVMAAILAGWAISQLQKRVPSNDIAAVQSEQPDMIVLEADTNTNTMAQPPMLMQTDEVSAITAPLPDNVLEYSDAQLEAAMNADPDALAAALNNIEPEATTPVTSPIENVIEPDLPVAQSEPLVEQAPIELKPEAFKDLDMTVTNPMKDFEQKAYNQTLSVKNDVAAKIDALPPLKDFAADSSLPDAVKKIEAQAFKGNANAQHDLAAIYTAGHGGVMQNFDKANFWFLKASQKNIPNAQYNLGVLNHQGLGTERNLDKALYWYREAASRGHAEAQYNLGISHIEGIGTDYDPKLAAGFFERAANNGIIEAAYNLGLIYENGLLGNVKLEEALLWYNIAARQGNIEAQKAQEQIAKELQIGTSDIDNFVDRMQSITESVKGKRAGPKMDKRVQSNGSSQKIITAQIQDYLILAKKYDGPADGINGAKTEAAIRSYQTANNLPVTGEPSKMLLNHMVSTTLATADDF